MIKLSHKEDSMKQVTSILSKLKLQHKQDCKSPTIYLMFYYLSCYTHCYIHYIIVFMQQASSTCYTSVHQKLQLQRFTMVRAQFANIKITARVVKTSYDAPTLKLL